MNLNEFHKRYWQLIEYRREYQQPKKVLKAWDDLSLITETDTFKVIRNTLANYQNPTVLDIGAGNRKLETIISKMRLAVNYKSLDISNTLIHDYFDINDVRGEYDLITLLEIIEHLSLEKFLNYITKVFDLIKKGGTVIISTPNIDHINQLWKQDITHIQQYPGKDIYAILRMTGFKGEINVYRINIRPLRLSIKKLIIEKARIILNKILGCDYAHGLLIVAKKNAS